MIKILISLILSLLISSPLFSNSSEKVFCLTSFEPIQSDFNFEIKPTQKNCKSDEKQVEIKKENFGIWTFVLIPSNPERKNEEKYNPPPISKE